MSATCTIVAARETHATEIARLSLELGYPMSVEQTQATLEAMASSHRYYAVVAAESAGRLLGWAVAERRLSLESGECVELTGLVVGAGTRRAGVGRALVASAESWALRNGFSAIVVRSNIARAESHPFYERLGFARTKTQHVYAKTLSSAG